MHNMHAQKSIDNGSVWGSLIFKDKILSVTLKEDAKKRKAAEDKVECKPGQVDGCIGDKVCHSLGLVRYNIGLSASFLAHGGANIDGSSKHVDVKGSCLNKEPQSLVSADVHYFATWMIAINKFVSDAHLGEEDGTLV